MHLLIIIFIIKKHSLSKEMDNVEENNEEIEETSIDEEYKIPEQYNYGENKKILEDEKEELTKEERIINMADQDAFAIRKRSKKKGNHFK